MGKRSPGLVRRKHDAYDTIDPRAVAALLPHLAPVTHFIEPCVGNGLLKQALGTAGHRCTYSFDLSPAGRSPEEFFNDPLGQRLEPGVIHLVKPDRHDARTFKLSDSTRRLSGADCFITNPPWTRELLHAIILNLYWQLPTWLLFDADWAHTQQAAPYMPLCRKIVSVGRLRWIPGTENDGKDNAAWYLFAPPPGTNTEFCGRRA